MKKDKKYKIIILTVTAPQTVLTTLKYFQWKKDFCESFSGWIQYNRGVAWFDVRTIFLQKWHKISWVIDPAEIAVLEERLVRSGWRRRSGTFSCGRQARTRALQPHHHHHHHNYYHLHYHYQHFHHHHHHLHRHPHHHHHHHHHLLQVHHHHCTWYATTITNWRKGVRGRKSYCKPTTGRY